MDVRVGGKRIREDFATEAQARAREVEILVAAQVGKPVVTRERSEAGANLTMADLQERTYRRYWQDAKSAKNLNKVSRSVVAWFGTNYLVTDITTVEVDKMIEGLRAARNANATINRKLAALSKMLRFAQTRGWITALPEMQRQREGVGRLRWFTPEEEARILATFKVWSKPDMHDLVAVLIDTGARLGELLKLEWKDVNAKYVTFWDTKNGLSRSVPMFPRTKAILAERRKQHAKPFDMQYTPINKAWERMRTHLGYADDPHFLIHTCRHTRASRFAQEGREASHIQRWLGHSSIRTTQRYTHLAPTSLDSMVETQEQTQPVRHLMSVKEG